MLILRHIQDGNWEWASSEIVNYEIQQTPDVAKRTRMAQVAATASRSVLLDDKIFERGAEIQALGFTAFDALHIACAENCGADVLLASDDRLLRHAARAADQLKIRIDNPLSWLREILAI